VYKLFLGSSKQTSFALTFVTGARQCFINLIITVPAYVSFSVLSLSIEILPEITLYILRNGLVNLKLQRKARAIVFDCEKYVHKARLPPRRLRIFLGW